MSQAADNSQTNDSRETPMTMDEYAELVRKWQQAYYTWQTSCMTYYK